MRNNAAVFFILISLMVIYLTVPAISAAVPDNERQVDLFNRSYELNLTAIANANYTLPSDPVVIVTPIHVDIRISDTLIPAPKGEMASGPRTIGFPFDPISLVIGIIVIVAGAAGAWYVLKRKPDETDEDE